MGVATSIREGTTAHLIKPGILLGLGFGGLFDGILLHQILQWHHMLTSTGNYPRTTVRGLEVNTLADGLFHAVTYAFLAMGLLVLWMRRRDTSGAASRHLLGWILAGWGIFNLVEGIIDHHILRIHHVRPGPNEFLFDMGFLALGAFLLVAGVSLGRFIGAEAR
jgi:uncharacterized membrane protein